MSYSSPISFKVEYGDSNLSSMPFNDLLEFQNEIKRGNHDIVSNQILLKPEIVHERLPNGEMPIHFAVRTNHPLIVKTLLEAGADPESKDFQGLSAIEHAVLAENEEILADIVKHTIGESLEKVQELIKSKATALHVETLEKKIKQIASIDCEKLPTLQRNIFKNNIDAIDSAQLFEGQLSFRDHNGLLLIDYAILGKNAQMVKRLVDRASLYSSQISAHPAVIAVCSDSPEGKKFFDELAGFEANVLGKLFNTRDKEERTPLHYAAVMQNFNLIKFLIEKNADLNLCDQYGISPLALIGATAFKKDPLSLPKAQMVLFATICFFWLYRLAVPQDLSSSSLKVAAFLMSLGTSFAVRYGELGIALPRLTNEKGKLVISCTGALPEMNVISFPLATLKSFLIANSTFKGLENCWKNIGYRRDWVVAKNIIIYASNLMGSAFTSAGSFAGVGCFFLERFLHQRCDLVDHLSNFIEVKIGSLTKSKLD